MNILFIHQNFPGQFRHIVKPLSVGRGHRLLALIPTTNRQPQSIPTYHYEYRWPGSLGHETVSTHYQACACRGMAVAEAMENLKAGGYHPDLIVGHGGWGETLFVRDVWSDVPTLLHAEFFYRGRGLDVGFDPETTQPNSSIAAHTARARSVVMLQALTDATHAVSPTLWQAHTFPVLLRNKIEIVHEGVDTDRAIPNSVAALTLRRDGIGLAPGTDVVTYVARNLEHYRGFHIFMRTLPTILAARPKARVVIVGGDDVSYGPRPPSGQTWRQIMLNELAGRLDITRIHFVGRVPHAQFINLMQVSAAHVYLTYPFVLSWSMLEAMSAGALIIGSRTGPVEEVIEDGRNGVLRDFFDIQGIADAVIDALAHPQRFTAMRQAARQTVVDRYDLKRICLPAWLKLIDRVAAMH